MKNISLNNNSPRTKKNAFSKTTSFIIIGAVVAALVGIATLVFSESPVSTVGLAQSQANRKDGKKYIATKKIIADKETGQLRKPDEKELKELIDSLKTMTKRTNENLKSVSLPNGGKAVSLDGFAGVMLAKPNADGTFETRCVFTFEEGAAFLGLEEDKSEN